MLFLSPNQQCQSTEGILTDWKYEVNILIVYSKINANNQNPHHANLQLLQSNKLVAQWLMTTEKTHCPAMQQQQQHGRRSSPRSRYGMVMVNVDLYSAIITKVSNALNTLVSGEKPGFQTLSKGLVVLLCAEVIWQRVPYHGAVHSECSASDSG